MYNVMICLLLLVLSGCSELPEEAVIVKISDSGEEVPGTAITFTEEATITSLQKAVQKADREPGVVDMTFPEYKLTLGEDSYFLWVEEERVTVMDTDDTHTIYSVQGQWAEVLYQVTTYVSK